MKAVIVDLDPQGTSLDWAQTRSGSAQGGEEESLVVACAPDQLGQVLATLSQSGVEMAFLDTAGTMGPAVEAALAASHFVLIPVTPSLADLRACLPTARAAHRLNKAFAFVLNSCPTGQQRISEAEALLSRLSGIAGEPVHRRMVYQDAYARGLGDVEMTDAKAVLEIEALWQWVKDKRNSNEEC